MVLRKEAVLVYYLFPANAGVSISSPPRDFVSESDFGVQPNHLAQVSHTIATVEMG